jgi:enoyl-CoA hydratase
LSEVLIERSGGLASLVLSRPQTLNALTLAMIRDLRHGLDALIADDTVQVIAVRSSTAKAFCAGGDMRRIRELSMAGQVAEARDFFREEYDLIRVIARCPKPYVALLDGIAMGGGLGISVHGHYRVVTERSVLAMPETMIGFFTDVGGSYFLSRIPQRAGWWLGITGERLQGAESVVAGLATHAVAAEQLPALLEALSSARGDAAVLAALNEAAMPLQTGDLLERMLALEPAFSAGSPTAVRERLAQDGSPVAEKALQQMKAVSPFATELTWRLLDRAVGSSLSDCLDRELGATVPTIQHPDFIEGVRAQLVDKDRKPRWV